LYISKIAIVHTFGAQYEMLFSVVLTLQLHISESVKVAI